MAGAVIDTETNFSLHAYTGVPTVNFHIGNFHIGSQHLLAILVLIKKCLHGIHFFFITSVA
jgi:hypothetical protein